MVWIAVVGATIGSRLQTYTAQILSTSFGVRTDGSVNIVTSASRAGTLTDLDSYAVHTATS